MNDKKEDLKHNEIQTVEKEEDSIGAFIGNLILCMIFPIAMLGFGPWYLYKGKYVKGLVLIVVVVTEFIMVLKFKGRW